MKIDQNIGFATFTEKVGKALGPGKANSEQKKLYRELVGQTAIAFCDKKRTISHSSDRAFWDDTMMSFSKYFGPFWEGAENTTALKGQAWIDRIKQFAQYRTGGLMIAMAFHYRFHAEIGSQKYAHQIDKFVFEGVEKPVFRTPVFSEPQGFGLELPARKPLTSGTPAEPVLPVNYERSMPKTGKSRLSEGELASIDGIYCVVNLSLAQHPDAAEKLGFIAEMNLRPLSTDCGVSFGFKTVALKARAVEAQKVELNYCLEWEREIHLGHGYLAFLEGLGNDRALLITAANGVIDRRMTLSDYEFFHVVYDGGELNIFADMIVHKTGMHVRKLDGSELDDPNKAAVISCIIAKAIGDATPNGWLTVASKSFNLQAAGSG